MGLRLSLRRSEGLLLPGILVALLFQVAGSALAAPGDLDTTFGSGGKVTTAISSSTDGGHGVAIDGSGRIVVAGNSYDGSRWRFAVARYNSDGSLDTTFDGDGKVTTAIGASDDEATSVAIDSSGRPVVAGYSYNGSTSTFAVVRYNTNGSLDTTFGSNGKVTTAVGAVGDAANAVVIDANGRIVAAGYSATSTPGIDFAVVRYNSDGTLDSTFDGDGKVTTAVGPSDDIAHAVAIDTSGRIVVAGEARNGSDRDFAVVRYNSNGSLDTTFGVGGKVTTGIGSQDIAYGVTVDASARIVVVGETQNASNFGFAVLRYNTNGSLDTTLAGTGEVTTTVGTSSVANAVAIDASGRLVVVGAANNGSNNDFALVRYNSNGTLDQTFGASGKVMTPVGTAGDVAAAVVIDASGRIVVAGYSFSSTSADDFAVLRYISQPNPVCGNGVVEGSEACDDGNTVNGDCCSSVCQFESTSTVCRSAAGECDAAETCTGASATCPADIKKPSGTACTDDSNPCSLDQCDGSNATCQHPAGNAGATCRASAGVCDVAETCTGTSTSCPIDTFRSASTICRSTADVCDVAENCTGSSANCPADAKSTSECRASTGPCDIAEACDGVSNSCPPDTHFASTTTVCRASVGVCDLAENCTGTSNTCPADSFVSSSTVCRSSTGTCDLAETCTGSSATCPTDTTFAPSTTVCRTASGSCDVAEKCTGTSNSCPADGFQAPTVICRSSAGACDVAESCTGSAASCPADSFQSSATICRSAAGTCDAAESCTGTAASCPADTFLASTTICRSSGGECDVAENCSGTSATCPADTKKSNGTACTSDGNPCSLDECDGANNTCQHPAGNAGAICRSATGVCDLAETCSGSSTTCPVDVFASTSMICRTATGACDLAESCTGSGPNCPADTFAPSSTTCRTAAGTCDVAETCSGSSASCPADGFLASATVCRSAAGVCDVAEACTGTSATCPADTLLGSSTVCRSAAGICDVQESCTGTNASCPTDAFVPSTTICRSSTGVCDVAENCPGDAPTCPADGFVGAGTICRSSAADCDAAELCSGSSGACPPDGPAAPGTPCSADGDSCTRDECDDQAMCVHPFDSTASGCSPFICHRAGPEPAVGVTVDLVDGYETMSGQVQSASRVCMPTSRNGGNPEALTSTNRLVSYALQKSGGLFAGVSSVNLLNAIGTYAVDVGQPVNLHVPGAENSPTPPLVGTYDHYSCYEVKRTKGTHLPKSTLRRMFIEMAYGSGTAVSTQPKQLCRPADQNGETPGAEDHQQQLLCYRMRYFRTNPPPNPGTRVITDQFVTSQTLPLLAQDNLLCIPSRILPNVCGDGIVLATEKCDDGNTNAGDGCSPSCKVEPGFRCAGSPSVCIP